MKLGSMFLKAGLIAGAIMGAFGAIVFGVAFIAEFVHPVAAAVTATFLFLVIVISAFSYLEDPSKRGE